MKEKSFVELVCARFDDDGVQVTSAIGMDGKEYPDPVPMAPPVGYTPPPDILTMIRQVVRNEQVLRLQDEAGFDTFDEAEDFEVEDSDFDPHTPYEAVFDPPPVPEGSGANGGPPASQQPAAPVEVSKPVVSGHEVGGQVQSAPPGGPVSDSGGAVSVAGRSAVAK